MNYPWLCVSGFGAHIKSTRQTLIIQKKNIIEEYPMDSVKNLLVIGGHTINSATVSNLVKNGTYITFFEPNGTPVGIIRPFGDQGTDENQKREHEISRHRYATKIAHSSSMARIMHVTGMCGAGAGSLFYEGELQFLQKSLEEIEYLVKLEEIRRLNRLIADMYYEILSRGISPEFGFRRRATPPHSDPINAMLSFGYSMLFGNCCVAVIGARLDPDLGFLNDGRGSLVLDLIEPLKPGMIDSVVFGFAREFLTVSEYEQEQNRCILSDEIMGKLIRLFQGSINNEKINEQVENLKNSLDNQDFKVLY
jgi:CRISPR-associated protein Cas1